MLKKILIDQLGKIFERAPRASSSGHGHAGGTTYNSQSNGQIRERENLKIATHIARILLGLIFFVLGLNPFLHFLPAILPSGLAGQYLNLLIQSHYVFFVAGVQLVGGALLLVNRYVPLALTLLGLVIVNILLYHFLLSHAGAGLAILVTILWGFLFFRHRQYFSSLFVQRTS